MYPYTNDVGKMKVSQALPLLAFIASDYKLDLKLLPVNKHKPTIHMVVWRGNHMKVAERILRNSQRNN